MKARLYGLDGLRGLAALSVVLFHYTVKYDQVYGERLPVASPLGFDVGQYGVELFFMISGFVIFMTLDKTKHAADFVVSRLSRLYPAYWVALATTFVVLSFGILADKHVGFMQLAANLSMLQGLIGVRHVDGVYWSLQVELVFYVWMLLFWATGMLPYIGHILIAWLLTSAFAHIRPDLLDPSLPLGKHLLILRYIPYFAMGIGFFLWSARRMRSRTTMALVVLSLLAVKPASDHERMLVSLGLPALFWLAVSGRTVVFEHRVLVFLGAISYPLYLLHQNIGYAAIATMMRGGIHGLAAAGLAALLALALAWGLHRLVEVPAMHAIRSWYNLTRRTGGFKWGR